MLRSKPLIYHCWCI